MTSVHGFGITCAFSLLVPLSSFGGQKLRYDTEYPAVHYSETNPTGPVARLLDRLESGELSLPYEAKDGYLAPLLRALDIPVSSQILVFTKTSLQKGRISPSAPRAIYFSDEAYVAYVQESPVLEISELDPVLGAVFYTLRQEEGPQAEGPRLAREKFVCFQCHDSFSMTGGGVPRHIMGSGIPDRTGRLVSHEGWYLTDDRTPIEKRWGGWYVTGEVRNETHMGNVAVDDAAAAGALDFTATSRMTDLRGLVDTSPYLGAQSDVVALLVIEHQVHVQNTITRVGWDARTALYQAEQRGTPTPEELSEIAKLAEPLVQVLLFRDETSLGGGVSGSSTFASDFTAKGPFDEEGRSLRQLDLKRRLFRYPLSYLVESPGIDALPEVVKTHLFERLDEELSTTEEGRTALEILHATRPTSGEER